MAKKDNLMPIEEVNSRRSREQHSEDSRKGGKASGKSRRGQAAFRDFFNSVLDEDGGKYNGETISKKKLIAIKALKYLLDENELSAHEFAKMFEIVRDTIGEKPVERVEQLNIDAEYEQSVDYVKSLMEDDDE